MYMLLTCSAQSWTKYHIAVTQRKEEEPTLSKDYYDTHSPAVRNHSPVGVDASYCYVSQLLQMLLLFVMSLMMQILMQGTAMLF